MKLDSILASQWYESVCTILSRTDMKMRHRREKDRKTRGGRGKQVMTTRGPWGPSMVLQSLLAFTSSMRGSLERERVWEGKKKGGEDGREAIG